MTTDETRQAMSLGDLRSGVVTIEVETVYGMKFAVTMKIPSYHKRQEIFTSVENPTVPLTHWDGTKKVANPDDKDYKRQMDDAVEERYYRLLAWALSEGGMPIEGATLADKARTFRNADIDSGIVESLVRFLMQATMAGKWRVTERADTFRGVRDIETPHLSVNGVDAEPMGAVDRRG